MNHRITNKIIKYIFVPIVFTFIFVLVSRIGMRSLLENMENNFRAVWVKGSPAYNFESIESEKDLAKDGILYRKDIILPKSGDLYGKITCQDIELNAPLYYGDDESILETGVGTYIGNGLPGEGKVVLMGAHDTTYFSNLEHIQVGNKINIMTTYGIFDYEVTDSRILDVTDSTAYRIESEDEMLILYTCYPFGEIQSDRDQRYYVYAKKVSGPQIGGESNE